ncbi:MAG TPA: FAD-dependent oxidoreductase [Xanthobacteraceae bacterium]|nr:FAD-dependent oxidoreductase [Xanthobacteraceae bacterium]
MTAEQRPQIKPDICVIGAGAGGLAAASAAAAFGVNVVLIERAKMGGEALNSGALPSKALLAAAAHADAFRNASHFGLKSPRFGIDFAAVRDHVREVVAAVEPQDSRERFNGLGVRVLTGEGRFTDAGTVAVDGYDVKARRFVIATGSSPALPAIPGLADTPHLTNETIFELAECPRHLIIIGADSIGLELAQAFRRFGAEVTVLDAAAPLAGADPECAGVVIDALEREGVALRAGIEIRRVRRSLARVQVDIAAGDEPEQKIETIEGSHLLVAVGRRPNLENLDLDAAGIRYQPSGIVVDRGLRTTNKQVYAIGDVTGAPQLSHLAHHQAGLVIRNALFRTPVDAERYAVPTVTYTEPELAQVGLTEDAARAQAGIIRVLRAPYRENDRARATGATNGHIKIVTDRKGDILGATIVGAGAAENIAAWTLAINQKLNIEAFAGVIVPYPTYAEVGKRAAMTYFTRGLTSPLVRRIIGWLRRFG